ncbi:MAG: alpha/beta hydrolase [Betaproteobacteria bacterium]|nr:alpha/beta hydrolase [Betaproteobacteria bacterium]
MESFKTSDGLQLRYVIDDYTDPWRAADTLVLLHAAMGSSRRFYAWVPHLARDYRVVRPDLRGHGESDAPGAGQLTFERLGLDVIELLDHIGAGKVHLAGSSAGAFIAQNVAIRYPQRIATLACFAATPGMKTGKQDYSGWVARIGAIGLAAFLRETIADRMDLNQVEPGFVDWFIAEAARTRVEVLARFVPLMAGIDLTPELPKIQCPTLAVAPGGDPMHTVDEYRSLERAIPRCEFIVYEGLPHNITDAVPDRCARELSRFLKSYTKA